MQIGRNIRNALMARCLNFVLLLINSVIVARSLGPTGKGLYTLFFTLSNTIMNLVECGLGDSMIYVVNNRRYRTESIIVSNMVTILLLSLVGVAIAIGVFAIGAFPEMNFDNALLLVLFLFAIPLFFVRKNVLDLLRARTSFAQYNTVVIVEELSYFFILLYLLHTNIKLNLILILYLINTVAIILITLHYLRSRESRIAYRVDVGYIKETLLYGLKIHAGNIFRILNYRLDSLIVGAFFSLAFVGYYSVAASIVQTAMLIGYSVGTVILPVISNRDFAHDRSVIADTVRITTLLSTLFCVGVYGAGGLCIRLFFGQAFIPAVGPLYWMIPMAIFINWSFILSQFYIGTGRGAISSYSSIILISSTVLFAFLLVPSMGINGLALAVTLSSLAQAIYLFLEIKKDYSFGLGELLVVRKNDLIRLRNLIVSA